jgi:hypothetical protein
MTKRCVFSFRFTRRGQTNLWDLDEPTKYEVSPDPSPTEPAATLADHTDKLEWYETALGLDDDDDLDEARDRAYAAAFAKFRERHPDADVII